MTDDTTYARLVALWRAIAVRHYREAEALRLRLQAATRRADEREARLAELLAILSAQERAPAPGMLVGGGRLPHQCALIETEDA